MRLLRRLAEWLADYPRWVIVPLSLTVCSTAVLFVVWVYITRSVGTVRVPSLTGKPLGEARRVVNRHGLDHEVIRTASMKTPKGEVIRQVPPTGARMKEHRPVKLFVSKGPEFVTVPDLRGRTPENARTELYRGAEGRDEQVGPLLTLGSMARVYSERQPEGEIVLQQPHPGRRVIRGSQVQLLVSKGPWPRRTVIPDLVGKSLEQARRELSQSHLSLDDVEYRRDRDRPSSVVLDQSPPSGRIVPRDRTVSLTVNLERSEATRVLRHTTVRITPPLSVVPGRMRVTRQDQRGTAEVFSDTVMPGRTVEFLTSVKGSAELTIYWNDRILGFRQLEARE